MIAIIRFRIFFAFQFTIRKFKDEDVQNYNYACCFVWVWNVVSHIEVGT